MRTPSLTPAIRATLIFFAQSTCIALVDFSKLLAVALTTMYVGRSSSTAALAGASLGSLAFNIAGNMVVAAPLAAMDTIAPQAYGAGNPTGVGVAALRSFILAIVLLVPTTPLWLGAEAILLSLGQPADVSAYAAAYMQLLLAGLLPLLIFEIARKFVYAQEGSRVPPLVAAVVGLASHFVWLELWCGARGVAGGAPLALSCTYATMATALVLHVRFRMPRAIDAWPRQHARRQLWSDAAGWCHFGVTSIAALLSLTEWLLWEVTAFRVGRFGTVAFAAYSVAYNLEPCLFMLPLGLGTALSNSIGNLLGAGRVAEAKKLAATSLGLGLLVVLAYVSAVLVLGPSFATLFSSDEEVARPQSLLTLRPLPSATRTAAARP